MILPRKSTGFTLIELLVVIGILTFLLAMVLIAVNPGKQFEYARNTQRHGDVTVLINAIDQYLIKTGSLPAGISSSFQTVKSGAGGVDICAVLVDEYIAALPADPTDGTYTDCTNYNTGYRVAKSGSNNRVTVDAPSAEGGVSISATR